MSVTEEYENALGKRSELKIKLEDILVWKVRDLFDNTEITIEAIQNTFSQTDDFINLVKEINELRLLENNLLDQIPEEDNE